MTSRMTEEFGHDPPKERPLSPAISHASELHSPGLEAIDWRGEDKEAYVSAPLPLHNAPQFSNGPRYNNGPQHNNASQYNQSPPFNNAPYQPHEQQQQQQQQQQPQKHKSRVCGLRPALFWSLLVLAILAIVALGVGLGVGLGMKHSSSSSASSTASATAAAPTSVPTGDPDYYVGGALNPAYYSKKGAFNGSGIALASQSFDTTGYGSIVMYFQHHSGHIRWQRLINQGWVGGGETEVVATDARNATPISAVAYALNGTSMWHIFYIDQNNIVRQKSNSNVTNIWVNGTVDKLGLKAFDANTVGMQACWYGSDYGDSDYLHTPLSGQTSNSTAHSSSSAGADFGMHLWVATNATAIQQYGWREGNKTWEPQYNWTGKNGHAGIGCFSWQDNSTTTYAMMVNLDQVVE
ncbi:hypothetical protein LTR66_014256, partial [Elasticomyces elasticus]